MRHLNFGLALALLAAAPVQAADWQGDREVRGGFAGARLKLSLGGGVRHRVVTSFNLAPATTRISIDGRRQTRIGEGLALNLTGGPSRLSFGGVSAGQMFGLRPASGPDARRKSGLSKGASIGIGVGVAVVAAVVVLTQFTCLGESGPDCGDDS